MTTINVAQLLEQTENDWKLLRETFEILCQEFPIEFSKLEAAIAMDDARRVAAIAHTIRGMLGNFCAEDACAAAIAIEQSAIRNDLSNGRALISRLKADAEQAQSALRQLLQGHGD